MLKKFYLIGLSFFLYTSIFGMNRSSQTGDEDFSRVAAEQFDEFVESFESFAEQGGEKLISAGEKLSDGWNRFGNFVKKQLTSEKSKAQKTKGRTETIKLSDRDRISNSSTRTHQEAEKPTESAAFDQEYIDWVNYEATEGNRRRLEELRILRENHEVQKQEWQAQQARRAQESQVGENNIAKEKVKSQGSANSHMRQEGSYRDSVSRLRTSDSENTYKATSTPYSWSPYNSNQEISKKMLSLVKFNAVCDLLSVIKEMNRIRVLGSQDKVDIKKTNVLDGIVNLFSGVFGIFELRKFTEKMEEFPSKDTHVLAARAFNLVYPLYNFILLAKDNEILKNTEKIAKYNKKTKRSLFKTKVVQSAWLAINKLAPYVGLALARNVNENTNLLNVFTNPERLKVKSFETFEVVKALSNISETMRKYCKHKAEVGDYKEYNFGN
ncbi:hypothetical protein [Candidatus Babela massiliensis]|uniref:Uncharacterized protein n=1 Tax=Candidatus Babela massiliensis TaxID=673862 RepID=V6DJJ7_9BACT|nr:hypothetical protein [Candidatus Babela massiliensis]CDK31053.1 hypothetical protein BABL1_gene_764 [Candidatus Babela massiliensis]